ncbi:MAG TPA: Gfo/Idh/MocA family oxidoreductase, partial [Roseiflexaceae bacterium]|nr:Gfo/Idh/MocA family oxidoreductase [Roseiflexaceae bacterium]
MTSRNTDAAAIRIALIGAAAGIASLHLRALAQIPEVTIVGMADIAADRVAARAAEYGCPSYADHRPMLAETRPDIAVICTPHPFHATLAIDAMRAGAHVLVEKPLAVTVAEADEMGAVSDQTGRLLA